MRKWLWAALAALFVASGAWAQGGQITQDVLRPTGIIAGASVKFCTEGSGCPALANVYTDRALTNLDADSIIVADARGSFTGYVVPGCYNLQISAAGFTTVTKTVCAPVIDSSPGLTMRGNIVPDTADTRTLGNSTNRFDATLDDVVAGKLNSILFVDGVKHATIQAAHDALPVSGGTIMLPSGNFDISTATAFTKPVHLIGAGIDATKIRTTVATINGLELNTSSADGSIIEDLTLDSTITKTAGAAVSVSGASRVTLQNIRFVSHFNAVSVSGVAGQFTLNKFQATNLVNSGIIINSTSSDFFISTGVMDNSPTAAGFGIDWRAGNGLWVTDADFIHFLNGLVVTPAASSTVAFGFFKGVAFDTNSDNGIVLDATAASSAIYFLDFTDCWSAGNTNQGVWFKSGTIDAVTWNGGKVRANGRNGFLVEAGTNWSIGAGTKVSSNSSSSSGTFHGVNIGANISQFKVSGIRSGPQGGESNTQGWGILINTGTSDNYRIAGNDLRGNVTGGLSDGGTGTAKHILSNLPAAAEKVVATSLSPTVTGADLGTSSLRWDAFLADLNLTSLDTYNGIATVSGGIPVEYATVDLTAQTAAITTTTLYAVPASGAGQYRVSWNAKVTTAATTGAATSTLGALTIVYTDPDGVVQTITAAAQIAAGTIATSSTGNSTTTVLLGLPLTLNVKESTNITYAMAYASDTAAEMQYNLHIKLEAL